jgi:hypothetical protein
MVVSELVISSSDYPQSITYGVMESFRCINSRVFNYSFV